MYYSEREVVGVIDITNDVQTFIQNQDHGNLPDLFFLEIPYTNLFLINAGRNRFLGTEQKISHVISRMTTMWNRFTGQPLVGPGCLIEMINGQHHTKYQMALWLFIEQLDDKVLLWVIKRLLRRTRGLYSILSGAALPGDIVQQLDRIHFDVTRIFYRKCYFGRLARDGRHAYNLMRRQLANSPMERFANLIASFLRGRFEDGSIHTTSSELVLYFIRNEFPIVYVQCLHDYLHLLHVNGEDALEGFEYLTNFI